LEPQEPKFTYTLAFYLHARGARDEAVTLLRTVTDQHMAYLDAYMLLGRIYEEGGQENDAIDLYRQTAAVEQFPAEVRRHFSSRAQWLSQRR
jgi:tetratricopeptide (TPR) repeat protein